MAPDATPEAGKYKRNWKKILFLVCMCALATGFLFVPMRSGQSTLQFLVGVVWGLVLGGILSELSGRQKQ